MKIEIPKKFKYGGAYMGVRLFKDEKGWIIEYYRINPDKSINYFYGKDKKELSKKMALYLIKNNILTF